MFNFTAQDNGMHNHLHLHYHGERMQQQPPVEEVVGSGGPEFTKEVEGSVRVNAVPGRTSLKLSGPGAMKIKGQLIIGSQ